MPMCERRIVEELEAMLRDVDLWEMRVREREAKEKLPVGFEDDIRWQERP
jgi:hypothetical protein